MTVKEIIALGPRTTLKWNPRTKPTFQKAIKIPDLNKTERENNDGPFVTTTIKLFTIVINASVLFIEAIK